MNTTILAAAFLSLGILAGCSNDGPPDREPGQFGTDRFGYKMGEGVIIGADNARGWFKAAVSGAKRPEGVPAKLALLETVKNCTFPRPAATDNVVQVQTDGTDLESGVMAISNADILKRANDYIAKWQHRGSDPGVSSNSSGDRLRVVDVVVTASAQPTYLVLAGGRNTLWNIHKAENATLSRVAIIGWSDAGIVNLDESVPVSVLTGKAAERCKVSAKRKPQDYWGIMRYIKDGDETSKKALSSRRKAYSSYNSWFARNFGVQSEQVVVGIDRMSHAIVGPMPQTLEARIPYRDLEGATVRVAPNDHIFFASSKSEYDQVHAPLVATKATAVFGSELTALNRTQ